MKSVRLISTLVGAASFLLAFAPFANMRASDHADGPTVAADSGADLADLYAFLDPLDNSKVVLIGTLHGFIVPGEGNNLALFDPAVRITFAIENTGDAIPDLFLDVNFTERAIVGSDTSPSQTATLKFRGAVPKNLVGKKGVFDQIPVNQPSESATPPPQDFHELSNAANANPGITFFAGETDDPFFFDIPGFSRFVAGVKAGDQNAADNLTRGRDTFAGYNVQAIVIRMPANLLVSSKKDAPSIIGVNLSTSRHAERTVKGLKVGAGPWLQVDRVGIPGINAVIIPYNHKNLFNASTPLDDAKGKFFKDIAGTFQALGTQGNSLETLRIVAGLPQHAPPPDGAPLKKSEYGTGDYLRLETKSALKPNDGIGGAGSNANGFPNGRRPGDDVIDVIINLTTNGGITTGDHVDANDRTFSTSFPYLATPNQPRDPSVDPVQNVDDGTRN